MPETPAPQDTSTPSETRDARINVPAQDFVITDKLRLAKARKRLGLATTSPRSPFSSRSKPRPCPGR